MNVEQYLERIKYDDDTNLTLKVLSNLQKHHLLNIPFENIDIHSKTKIELDLQKIYDKIVVNKRGGFCYELNGLFGALLRNIGFKTRIISGRVYDKKNGYGNEYDHLALLIDLESKEYLVDVGFGEFVFKPLEIDLNKIQKDERGEYHIDKYDEKYLRVNKMKGKESIPQYLFTKNSREFYEFTEMCNYHQTSPLSHFTQRKFLGIPIENGRISIVNNKLKINRGDEIEEREIGKEGYEDLLIKYFKFES